jgi:predicted O-methyltransferase YrrM
MENNRIENQRIAVYIRSLERGNTPFLEELEKEAHRAYVPVIRREMQGLLKFLLAEKKPGKILEVGTAIGFSALFMCEYNPVRGHLTTIEKYEKRIPIARENFKKAGREDQITLLEGDAMEVLDRLSDTYDFIFMDAAKGQYIHFLPKILKRLNPGGILVSDNVLQEGDIAESKFAVTRRNRTIHNRMREYLYTLTHSEELTTVVLPVGDGAALSVRKESPIQ